MEDRTEHRQLGPIGPARPTPLPPPAPPKVPGPIPWIATGPVSQLTPVRGPTSRRITDSRRETAQDASPLVSCFWCERLHPAKHPLSVCTDCAARFSTMRSLEMIGSYPLSDQAIDDALTRRCPGNYALGYLEDNTFQVFFVGRSDSDVRQRLHEWVGMPSRYEKYASPAKASWGVHRRARFPVDAPVLGRVGNAESSYTHFAYSYAPSAEAAFEKECRNYHDFGGSGGLDNEGRPARALGAVLSA